MLELNYSLSEKDFLYLQLYTLSHDEKFRKQRLKEKYRIIGISLLFGVILLFEEGYRYYSYFFIGSSLIFFIIYPWWSTWFYRRMYKRQIEAQLKDSFPYPTRVSFSDNAIDVKSRKGNTRFLLSEIHSMIETGEYFLISMNQYISIIIPKDQVQDCERINEQLHQYTQTSAIPFVQNLDWKWK